MSLKTSFLLAVLLLAGCATPPEVKQLSVKQNEYFDAAIVAVNLQSEALILATEKLVEQAKQRIADEEAASKAVVSNLIQEGALSATDADTTLNELALTVQVAEQSRQKLDADLALIRQKTEELALFLEKMKEVNVTLDSYIQSEKAGEAVLSDVMKQPSVNALLNTVTELTPRIQGGLRDISSLLNGIN